LKSFSDFALGIEFVRKQGRLSHTVLIDTSRPCYRRTVVACCTEMFGDDAFRKDPDDFHAWFYDERNCWTWHQCSMFLFDREEDAVLVRLKFGR
jgi:hypothetical protein